MSSADPRSLFEEILKNHPRSSTQLPHYKTELSFFLESIQRLREWAQDMWDKIAKSLKLDAAKDLPWGTWVTVFVIVLAAILVALSVYSFVKNSRNFKLAGATMPRPLAQHWDETAIELFRKGDLAEATRVLWNSFLQKKRLNIGMTPYEYSRIQIKFHSGQVYYLLSFADREVAQQVADRFFTFKSNLEECL